MRCEYNDVDLHVIELPRYVRRNLYTPDGADLVGVEHVLAMSTTYSPGGAPALVSVRGIRSDIRRRLDGEDDSARTLLAAARGRDIDRPPFIVPPRLEDPGTAPAPRAVWHAGTETDAELFDRLMQPRKKLILWASDRRTGREIRWLESPRPGFSVDAANGPFPLACDVVSVKGEGLSVGVLFQIRTVLPPCAADRFVLAHRWEMSHGHDADHYLTRTIKGQVVFHSGVRDLLGLRPDDVRNQFIHPIPVGFQRQVPVVTMSSDGLTLSYVVTDTNPKIVFSPGDSGCTDIAIMEKVTYLSPTLRGA